MNIRHLLHRIEELEARVKQQDAEIAKLHAENKTPKNHIIFLETENKTLREENQKLKEENKNLQELPNKKQTPKHRKNRNSIQITASNATRPPIRKREKRKNASPPPDVSPIIASPKKPSFSSNYIPMVSFVKPMYCTENNLYGVSSTEKPCMCNI